MRIREMREILKLIDDMPREEQLRCVEKLDEMWRDFYDNRFEGVAAHWEAAKRKYRAYLAANGRTKGYRREYLE